MTSLDYKYIAKLVDKARLGDSDAFAELYAATYQRQYHFAYRYLKDESLAQDALQETYISALKNLSNLKDATLVVAWLNQINFRVCYNLQLNRKRYNNKLNEYESAVSTQDKATSSTPDDTVIKIDSKEYIMNQILKLPFTESQVIILKYYQNMKNNEIANLMDISRRSVKRYLHNGKARLKKILQN